MGAARRFGEGWLLSGATATSARLWRRGRRHLLLTRKLWRCARQNAVLERNRCAGASGKRLESGPYPCIHHQLTKYHLSWRTRPISEDNTKRPNPTNKSSGPLSVYEPGETIKGPTLALLCSWKV